MAGEHAGHRQRMRERFLAGGLEGFADHEVLELMLFYAIPQRNVNPLAHRLLDRFGTLHAVLEAPVEELMKVEGVGQYAALLLSLFSHAARRLEMSRENTGKLICNRGMAEKHAVRLLQGLRTEHFYAVCLDGRMQLIADELISRRVHRRGAGVSARGGGGGAQAQCALRGPVPQSSGRIARAVAPGCGGYPPAGGAAELTGRGDGGPHHRIRQGGAEHGRLPG